MTKRHIILAIIPIIALLAAAPALSARQIQLGVSPVNNGNDCPSSHPIKAKKRSMLYHPPNGWYYDITKPDYCYATKEDAMSDGFRLAKRGYKRLKVK